MDRVKFKAQLTPEEGDRKFPYDDATGRPPAVQGKLTIGIGWNLTDNGIPQEVEDLLFNIATDRVEADLTAHCPWWPGLPDPQQRAVADLCFNMGWPTLSAFGTFLGLMALRQYAAAALDLTTTAWYKEVGSRGPKVVSLLLEGVVSTPSNA